MTDFNAKRKQALFNLETNENSQVKNVIAVVSGKGGVGKSMVTSTLAVAMAKKGYKVAILDADITGPSIARAFNLKGRLEVADKGLNPMVTKEGIKIVSANLIIDDEKSAVVWRAPMLTGAIRQFWTDVNWGEIDYMFVDLPPGTSDAQLTIFQSITLMGIIMVSSPQDLVNMIVEKALGMANKLDIPILGLVENFSYFKAPDTGKKYEIFGKSKVGELSEKYGLDILAQIPINPKFADLIDQGKVESIDTSFLDEAVEKIEGFEKYEK